MTKLTILNKLICMKKLILFFIISLFCFSCSHKQLIVKDEGAAVYSEANFDSKILKYLNKNQNITILKFDVKGKDSLGLFYKVAVDQTHGFIPKANLLIPGEIEPEFNDLPELCTDDCCDNNQCEPVD